MPTSPKRTKKRRRLRFPVLIPGICILAGSIILLLFLLKGCNTTKTDNPESDHLSGQEKPEAAQLEDSGRDFSSYFGHKGLVRETCSLYIRSEDGFLPYGTFEGGSNLEIGAEQEQDLLAVADSPFYIHGDSLEPSQRWYRSETHLLPYSEDLTTAEQYEIYDERGNRIASIQGSDAYPILVKPSAEDNRYGIPFMNAVYYINADQVVSTAQVDRLAGAQLAQEVPVLMYHFFYSEAEGGSRVDGNYVEVNELDEQLSYIEENGFTACTMRELQYWMEGRAQLPYHTVAITIDDADPSVHQYAMPVFVKHGICATNFVICGWQPAEMPYELWEMRENGMELQSHGFLTHTGGCSGMGHGGLLMCMDHNAGVEDTIRSFDYVDGGFVYCYPFGDINENAESIVRDGGAKLAFTTEGGRIHPGMDPLALPRVRVTGGNGLNAFAASIG